MAFLKEHRVPATTVVATPGRSHRAESESADLDPAPIPLSGLATGQPGRLLGSTLPGDDGKLLAAMGLAEGSDILVCRQGHPCIVRSGGTRIGLSTEFARQILVVPGAIASGDAVPFPARKPNGS